MFLEIFIFSLLCLIGYLCLTRLIYKNVHNSIYGDYINGEYITPDM